MGIASLEDSVSIDPKTTCLQLQEETSQRPPNSLTIPLAKIAATQDTALHFPESVPGLVTLESAKM